MREVQKGPVNPGAATSQRDRASMVIMLLASVGALFAFAEASLALPDAGSDMVVLETWRALGFMVFAGIFLLLALRPRQYPGIWELAFLHKVGMAAAGIILIGSNAVDAGTVALSDGVLAGMIVVAYILARGYTSWTRLWMTGEHQTGSAEAV